MEITRRMSPNMNIGRQGWRPDLIVCHITEGSFDGTVNWITRNDLPPEQRVSYHFVVARDGRVVQAVDINNTAWGNGTTSNGDNRDSRHSPLHTVRDRGINANLYSVSIGFEGRLAQTQGSLTHVQLEAAVWLIAHIREEINRLYSVRGTIFPFSRQHIVGHHEITPRTRPNCPGPQFPFDAVVQYLYEKPPEPLEPEEPSVPQESIQLPSSWATEACNWGIETNITDGNNPQNTATREQVVRMLFSFHNYTQSDVELILPPEPPPVMSGHEPSGWALNAWNWARSLGITDGTNPQNSTTREQVVAMLFNFYRLSQ